MWILAAFILVVVVAAVAKGSDALQHGVLLLNCNFVVKDAKTFQEDVVQATTRAIAEKRPVPLVPGSNAARVMVMLMRDLFPTCTWPPPAAWSLTDPSGTKLTWSQWVERVEMISSALDDEDDDGLEGAVDPRHGYGQALSESFGTAIGGEREERIAERGCNCDGVRR